MTLTLSFGSTIATARKNKNLSLRELAALILKEDGQPISAQYLNDLEHDRRNPPSEFLIRQLAQALDMNADLLFLRAGEFPADMRTAQATDQSLQNAIAAFRKELEKNR